MANCGWDFICRSTIAEESKVHVPNFTTKRKRQIREDTSEPKLVKIDMHDIVLIITEIKFKQIGRN